MENNIVKQYKHKFFANKNNQICINLNFDHIINQNLSLKHYIKDYLNGGLILDDLKIKITLSQNAQVSIIDDLLDFDITNSKIEFVLDQDSILNYTLIVNDHHHVNQTDDGLVLSLNKNNLFQKEISFIFSGKNAKANAKCLIKGSQNNVFKIKTIQDHQVGHTKSDLLIKGAFCNQSQLICDNLIKVSKNAQKVEVSQLNRNLLLGCNAQAISIPKLEVEADDVKCKHGAAVSKLNDEQIFYLQSRGLNYCDAKNLLIDAFLN